jgi:ATP-dependent DNA helicase RecQ
LPAQELPDEAAALVLKGVTQLPYPVGRKSLARALQGAASSRIQADSFPLFGALAGWTQKAIRQLITQLESQGRLTDFQKSGYWVLQLTDGGRAWLKTQPDVRLPLPTAAQNPPPSGRGPTAPRSRGRGTEDAPGDYDVDLFERLRAWRLETARAIHKPPYVIFHDATLKRIAASHPADLVALAEIKGIGPRKMEQYGESVLAIVAGHQAGQGDKDPA